jgi:hypothetical protein
MLLMTHPVSAEKSYAVLGLVLGVLPPAAIFGRFFGYGLSGGSLRMNLADGALFFLSLVMSVVSSLGGYAMGSLLSRAVYRSERDSWPRMLVVVSMLGAAWGAATGVAGGFFFFGFGAILGFVIGVPIGACGFLVFAIIHRMLEQGGMIDRRHLIPMACGIALGISSFVLGL